MKFFKYFQSLTALILIMCWTANVTPSTLHTYHTSLTRIDYNRKEKLTEITIELFVHDLVPVLERRSKKQIDIGNSPDIDNLILNYLSENFILIDKQNSELKLRWVGKEIQSDMVYVYVEAPLEETFEGYKLRNSIFFESFPEQTNLVVARFDEKKVDLLFKSGDKFKEIKPSEFQKEK